MTDACVLHFFNSQLAAPQESLIFIARWFLKIAVLWWLKWASRRITQLDKVSSQLWYFPNLGNFSRLLFQSLWKRNKVTESCECMFGSLVFFMRGSGSLNSCHLPLKFMLLHQNAFELCRINLYFTQVYLGKCNYLRFYIPLASFYGRCFLKRNSQPLQICLSDKGSNVFFRKASKIKSSQVNRWRTFCYCSHILLEVLRQKQFPTLSF